MEKIIGDLRDVIEKYHSPLQQLNDAEFSTKPSTEKWSKKEEIGHLIDSAQNNIQRFIRVQYEENVHIIYHPDNWVDFNDYQNSDSKELVELWYLLNKQIIAVLEKMPREKYEVLMSFDKDASVRNTNLYIAADYVEHMTHHLESIVKN